MSIAARVRDGWSTMRYMQATTRDARPRKQRKECKESCESPGGQIGRWIIRCVGDPTNADYRLITNKNNNLYYNHCTHQQIMERLGALIHGAGKVIFMNNHVKRLEQMRHIDGILL